MVSRMEHVAKIGATISFLPDLLVFIISVSEEGTYREDSSGELL